MRKLLLFLAIIVLPGCATMLASQENEITSDVAQKIANECYQTYAAHYPNSERVIVDGYYAYGRVCYVSLSLTEEQPMSFPKPPNRKQRSETLAIMHSINGRAAIGREITASTMEPSDVERWVRSILRKPEYDSWKTTGIEYTISDGGPLYKKLSENDVEFGYQQFNQKTDRHWTPEALAEKAEQERKQKAAEQAMTAATIELFITANPFYYPKAEDLFRKWFAAVSNDDQKFLAEYPQLLSRLSQDEQYEVKRKIRLFLP